MAHPSSQSVLEHTQRWVERVVLGLGLCPFVAPLLGSPRLRYQVSAATATEPLLTELASELTDLLAAPPDERETTLLIHPHVLAEFPDYNEFLDDAEQLVEQLGFTADVQVVSFHPGYRFAGNTADQIDNYTNRSPYPMLHLLRQASVDRARAAYRDIEGIPARNIATLHALGAVDRQRLREFRF